MIQIQKNLTLPKRDYRIYPWPRMEPGDSFLFPAFVQHPHQTAASATRRLRPKRFTARKTREGYRCWRIA